MLTDDGRTPDAGDYHPISSPGAFGSGELTSWIWILCQNSLTRELKIRFVRLVPMVAVWDFTSFWQCGITCCSMLDNDTAAEQVMLI